MPLAARPLMSIAQEPHIFFQTIREFVDDGRDLFALEIDWIAGDVHESDDDIHTCSPLQLKLFPVGLRLRTVPDA